MELVGTEAAAEFLGVTPRRVRAIIQAGLLPALMPGRDYVVDLDDLKKFKAIQRTAGRPKKEKPKTKK